MKLSAMNIPARLSSAAPLVLVVIGLLYFVVMTLSVRAQDPDGTLDPTAPPTLTTEAIVTQAPVTIVDEQGRVVVMSDTPPIVYIAVGGAIFILVVVIFYQNQLIKLVAGLTTPETAREFVQYGISMGGEMVLNNLTNQTETKLDDRFVAGLFAKRGYKVTPFEDGSYHIEPPSLVTSPPADPAPAAAPVPATTNITINNTDAPGGAAAEGPAAFPNG